MDHYLLALFALNVVLILADASLGYHVVPALLAKRTVDEEEPETPAEAAARQTRPLLAGVVALYMFFTCLAYFRHSVVGMLVVTGVVTLDLLVQLVIRRRLSGGSDPG